MKLKIEYNEKNKEIIVIKHFFDVLKNKIKTQVSNWEEEMKKENNQKDFYEGRKIEAEVILSWCDYLELKQTEQDETEKE